MTLGAIVVDDSAKHDVRVHHRVRKTNHMRQKARTILLLVNIILVFFTAILHNSTGAHAVSLRAAHHTERRSLFIFNNRHKKSKKIIVIGESGEKGEQVSCQFPYHSIQVCCE